jgi:hypothetical protein
LDDFTTFYALCYFAPGDDLVRPAFGRMSEPGCQLWRFLLGGGFVVALSAQTAAKVASKLAIAQKKRKLALRDDSVRPAFGRMSETGCQLFRRPRSQVRVEQGSCLTAGYCGSGRADDYTSLSATTSKLGCFGYIHDLLRSLLGWDQVKSSQVKSSQGEALKITGTG